MNKQELQEIREELKKNDLINLLKGTRNHQVTICSQIGEHETLAVHCRSGPSSFLAKSPERIEKLLDEVENLSNRISYIEHEVISHLDLSGHVDNCGCPFCREKGQLSSTATVKVD